MRKTKKYWTVLSLLAVTVGFLFLVAASFVAAYVAKDTHSRMRTQQGSDLKWLMERNP